MQPAHIVAEATRLLDPAARLLSTYPLKVKELTHLATHTNVLYRVVAADGRQMALRVGRPDSNTRPNIDYEVGWLTALNQDTDLDVVTPVATEGGDMVAEIVDPKTGRSRLCVLFSWVPGSPMGLGSGPFAYRLMGRLSALLHQHGKIWLPEDRAELRKWNAVFYYGPSDPVIVFDPGYDHIFKPSWRSTIERAIDPASRVIEESWRSGQPHIVHGDLHEWNVHLVGTRIYALDFEDVMMATAAQDISVSLYSSRASDRKEEVRRAFRAGYEEEGVQWPIESERDLDGLHAARQIMLMNYAARALPPEEVHDYLDKVMPWLEHYVGQYA